MDQKKAMKWAIALLLVLESRQIGERGKGGKGGKKGARWCLVIVGKYFPERRKTLREPSGCSPSAKRRRGALLTSSTKANHMVRRHGRGGERKRERGKP